MFNLFIKSNTLFRAISGVFSASQPQPNGCVCDAANETTRLGFAEQRYWLHGIFWSIGSILPIKTQNSKLKTQHDEFDENIAANGQGGCTCTDAALSL